MQETRVIKTPRIIGRKKKGLRSRLNTWVVIRVAVQQLGAGGEKRFRWVADMKRRIASELIAPSVGETGGES